MTTAELASRSDGSPDKETAGSSRMYRDDQATPSLDGRESDSMERAPLLATDEAAGFRRRWADAQGAFVDEPRAAVEKADTLVAELMQSLAASFASARADLESQWDRGDNVDTEQLRNALRRYRSFFERLLAV